MWAAVLMFGLVTATDPFRLGITALFVSRPRPMLQLLAFWIGSMTGAIGVALVLLFGFREHLYPFAKLVKSAVTSPALLPYQVAVGLLLLPAAVIVLRRSRRPVVAAVPVSAPMPVLTPGSLPEPVLGDDPSALAVVPKKYTILSLLSWRNHLEKNSSVGLALVAGACTATPPLEFLGAMVAIMASGAAAGTQVAAAALYAVVAFMILEIPLASHLVWPSRTEAIVLGLHNWINARRGPILAVIFGTLGALMVVGGVAKLAIG
jgi:Sap, sulfolipid-1-addressing protein